MFELTRGLRVLFLLKTDSGYPSDAEDSVLTLAKPENSLRFKQVLASTESVGRFWHLRSPPPQGNPLLLNVSVRYRAG